MKQDRFIATRGGLRPVKPERERDQLCADGPVHALGWAAVASVAALDPPLAPHVVSGSLDPEFSGFDWLD